LPKPIKVNAWIVLGLQALSALVETLALLVISFFALTMAAPEATVNHYALQAFLAFFPSLRAIAADPRNLVILSSSLMVFFVGLKCALTVYASHKATVLAQRISLRVAGQALADYLAQDYLEHLKPESQGILHSVLNRDRLGDFALFNLFFYANFLCCLALFVTLSVIEPKLTLIVVVAFGLAALVIYGSVRRQLDRRGQAVQDFVVREGRETMALSQGIREIVIYGREDTALNRILALGQKAIRAKAYLNFFGYVPSQALEIVGFGTIGLIVVLMILSGLPLADIIASTSILMLTAWRILPAVSRCLSYTVNVRSLRAQSLALVELAERSEAKAPPSPPDPDFAFKRDLALVEAAFAYPSSGEPAVKNLNLKIEKGQSVGLIGLSGSGKTTLALLLSGLISPQAGSFLVDGERLTPARRAAYFKILGYVPQNPLLVEGTLAENVAFSQWGEEFDRDRILAACQEAAMDFALNHPKGLDQPLNASSLSGGQAQRAAIARALYPRPQIVIFDEATSALDQASENIIKKTLERLQGRATVVIVAHRLTTVENCDLVVWVDSGSIRLAGPPAEVIALYEKAVADLTAQAAAKTEASGPPEGATAPTVD
jgi:ABC-type multidrug transport system fused ATPase/permease subunit